MKKILLCGMLISSIFSTKAQTSIFSEDFNSNALPTGWTLIDADGDNNNWSVVQITDDNGNPAPNYPTPCLRSASWTQAGGALTPNNWIFTPAIDLSAYTGQTVTLKWKVSAADASYDAEKYSVYVSELNTTAGMLASTTTFTENTLSGVNSFAQRTLDISALAGKTNVYIAFRHYDVSDEFTMEIDDIEVTSTTASSEKFFSENFSLFPNPATDILNITSLNGIDIKQLTITDLTGRKVKTSNNTTSINVSDLSSGTYLIDITTNNGKGSSKFVKK